MATTSRHPRGENWVLAALGDEERKRVLRYGDRVSLTREQTLLEANQAASSAYFPVSAVVSLVESSPRGEVNEVATVGRDGMLGVPFFLGDELSPWNLLCQIPGEAVRVPIERLGNIVSGTPDLREVLGRYSQALMVQIARNFACSQLHPMLQRCSRWILLVHWQSGRDEFPLTQRSLATMLGVRRATVTETAGQLQKAGAISYHHGSMRVTDLSVLNDLACGCCTTIKQSYGRLLPP